MTSPQQARSKAAIAHFTGDGQMWAEAMWQLLLCYAECEFVQHYDMFGKLDSIEVKNEKSI